MACPWRCCGCCPESFRKEFRWNKCGLSCSKPSCMYSWQFKWPAVLFLIFKAFMAAYTLSWLVVNIVSAPGAAINKGQSPFVFLTTWSYILLVLYLFASLLDALYMTFRHAKDGYISAVSHQIGQEVLQDKREEVEVGEMLHAGNTNMEHAHEYPMTWYHGVVWVLHGMINGAAPVVTIIYFAFLYPLAVREDPSFAASPIDINIHGINTVIMILDNFFGAIPIRIMHAIYPMIYGMIYIVFSLIYYAFDTENHILYPDILDWSKPAITIPVIIFVLGVMMPLVQLAWYGWFRLRLIVFRKVYKRDYCDPTKL